MPTVRSNVGLGPCCSGHLHEALWAKRVATEKPRFMRWQRWSWQGCFPLIGADASLSVGDVATERCCKLWLDKVDFLRFKTEARGWVFKPHVAELVELRNDDYTTLVRP